MIGEGFHAGPGEAHAERVALAACAEDPAGATLYVSLEPCAHHGRTAPVHGGDPRGRDQPRGGGLRRPDAQGLRARPRDPPRRGRRGGRLRRRGRLGRPAPQPALPQARAHRPPAGGLQVRHDARRQGGHPHRRLAVDLGRGQPRPLAPLARRVGRRGGGDRHRAGRRPAAHRPNRGRVAPAAPRGLRLGGAPAGVPASSCAGCAEVPRHAS